ncbi:hypothetical protein KZZ52_06395 [Dactylosporangium sp. AC04546]|uniref:hypothetical protein n=1 Tax=Dactylosporangium sp. AC04546 TaxID=2862460 RepID=UPI001EDD771E|nr:hypothetical protein [Dactylosporangium sp. AC04546]WVK85028.1 hypothetical protein KZZ52_06395 [Dactylosporangium sp. AC04546]
MEAESVKLGGADVDDDSAVPVSIGVTPAGGDDQDVVDVEGHRVDAVLAQSGLQRFDWLRAP